ncbi:hypothetical protein NFX31_13155 [Microbacterium azadirachtae]|uniref:hypothetical protein n=1 Tax=Microbacterium azadirachtae TaxID=582680 RepID=UPI0021D4F274|nr:hypothetical protein [Microbacterium azadirachtae]UXW85155.1 hypothetical protein NFX31_13155 [Microbacterium azadirachtae]
MIAAKRSRLRRAVLAMLVVAGCAAALLWPRPAMTDASYTDGEYAASGTVTAATLSNPSNMTCTVQKSLGVFTSVTIGWHSAYPLTTTVGGITVLTASSSVKTSTVTGISSSGTGPYTYTVTLDQNLLLSLVTNLLGSTTTFTVKNAAGTNWTSTSLTKTLTMSLAGLNATCV